MEKFAKHFGIEEMMKMDKEVSELTIGEIISNHKEYFLKHNTENDIKIHMHNFELFEEFMEKQEPEIIYSERFFAIALYFITHPEVATTLSTTVTLTEYLFAQQQLKYPICKKDQIHFTNLFTIALNDAVRSYVPYIRLINSSETLSCIFNSHIETEYNTENTKAYIRSNIMAMRLILVLDMMKHYMETVSMGKETFPEDIMDITPWYDVL